MGKSRLFSPAAHRQTRFPQAKAAFAQNLSKPKFPLPISPLAQLPRPFPQPCPAEMGKNRLFSPAAHQQTRYPQAKAAFAQNLSKPKFPLPISPLAQLPRPFPQPCPAQMGKNRSFSPAARQQTRFPQAKAAFAQNLSNSIFYLQFKHLPTSSRAYPQASPVQTGIKAGLPTRPLKTLARQANRSKTAIKTPLCPFFKQSQISQ